VAGAGVVTICLLIAAIVTTGGNNDNGTTAGSPGNPLGPTATSAPTGSQLVGSRHRRWQTAPLVLDGGAGTGATFLINTTGATEHVHEALISFTCGEGGRVQVVPALRVTPPPWSPQ